MIRRMARAKLSPVSKLRVNGGDIGTEPVWLRRETPFYGAIYSSARKETVESEARGGAARRSVAACPHMIALHGLATLGGNISLKFSPPAQSYDRNPVILMRLLHPLNH
jgi:hypothetical protein